MSNTDPAIPPAHLAVGETADVSEHSRKTELAKIEYEHRQKMLGMIGNLHDSGILGGSYGGGRRAADMMGNPYATHVPTGPDMTDPQFRMEILAYRLRLSTAALKSGLPGIASTYGHEKVFVHFPTPDDLAVFSDDAAMYPSDELVAKLRLCIV